MTSSCNFRWLHFSDIHVGVGGLKDVWPRFNTIFLQDLEKLVGKNGPVDLIIFSGDLVQKGLAEEFKEFDEIIGKILDKLGEIQDKPQIITVPGNHDLERPKSMKPEAIAFTQYWKNSDLRTAFWKKEGKNYKSFIDSVFKNYSTWRQNSIYNGIHLPPSLNGILPGDASYVCQTKQSTVGISALNSTWLQLSGSDYQGELHVDARQLQAITDGDPDRWIKKNDANLLVTHQPADWFHKNVPTTWDNDINPAGRFDLHLFGHMHEPRTTNLSMGGNMGRRQIQATSLFGMQWFGDDKVDRVQGYALNQVEVLGAQRKLTSWPRRLAFVNGEQLKLIPDSSQDLDEDSSSFTIDYSVNYEGVEKTTSLETTNLKDTKPIDLAPPASFNIETLRQSLDSVGGHHKVRRVEQEAFVQALQKDRIVWLVSDWGMGLKGFISSVHSALGTSKERTFHLDLSEYVDRPAFFDEFRGRFGTTFQNMCEALSGLGPSILVLDDIDVASAMALENLITTDIEELSKTIADYAPDAFLIIRCRKEPKNNVQDVIELKPLDEVDLAIYVSESEYGDDTYKKPAAVSALFRHTDGIPSRIDAALRDLEFMSVDDLLPINPDYSDNQAGSVSAPPALIATLSGMKNSDDRAIQRAYMLLLVLSALPRGEQLIRLKRFLGVHPIGPIHARVLSERSLIDTSSLTSLDGMSNASTQKTLIVPRPVREYVREITEQADAKKIDMQAIELFFGQDWRTGKIDNSQIAKQARQALCSDHEIFNASALIYRIARRSIDEAENLELDAATKLASAFIEELLTGNHFRSSCMLCEDIIGLVEDNIELDSQVNFIRYQHARALRMMSESKKAQSIFELLDYDTLSKPHKQLAKLGLALCLEKQGAEMAAATATVAKQVIAINKDSVTALQAEIILAEQIEGEEEKIKTLNRLLRKAEKRKSHTLASNIRLTVAKIAKNNGENADDLLRETLRISALNGDAYNSARAVVNLASKENGALGLSENERNKLIEAYHYLYNERLFNIFDRCHASLWRVFQHDGQRQNLLNLFRHSSFIWRLNGKETREADYLKKITGTSGVLLEDSSSRDGAYFIARIGAVLKP